MIEIENENNRNLKNVKQIGTPREENKIYIENMTYNKIKEENYREKRVYLLMGHTERMGNRYATFVEAAISVREIDFSGFLPIWNNTIWSEAFREIKRLYEDMIIVGWALDVRGMSLKLTPDLERLHREHFGGVHQVFFLLDTMEREETFYIYKENKLVSKDGFYIYHKARSKERIPITVIPEKQHGLRIVEPEVDVAVEVSEQERIKGGRYRQMMQGQKKAEKDNGNAGIAIAVAMLIFVIGVGVYENSGTIFKKPNSLETNLLQEPNSTETMGENIEESDTEASGNVIDVEVVPGSE